MNGRVRSIALQSILAKSTLNKAGKAPGVNPLQRSKSQRFTPLKAPGKGRGHNLYTAPPEKTSNTNASQRKTAKSVPPEADLIDMAFTKRTPQSTPTSSVTLITHRIYTHKNLHHDRAHCWDALLNRLSNRRTYPEEQLRSPR